LVAALLSDEALLMSVLLIGLYEQSNEAFVPYYETAQN